MLQFQRFLTAKAVDLDMMISWLEEELGAIEAQTDDRVPLFQSLRGELARAKEKLGTLQLILSFGVTTLLSRALPLVHDIQGITSPLANEYLPALQRETDGDRFVRACLRDVCGRFGLDWIEDVVIRLDGEHATLQLWQEVPLFFGPARHGRSLLDMAGLYHELGHGILRRYRDEIRDRLTAIVDRHFHHVVLSGGPLPPDKRAARERAVANAALYWSPARLSEVFCDVFATFACGPAHYVSFVDLGLRSKEDPFEVRYDDAHPPLAARVHACFESLALPQRREEVLRLAEDAWSSHERGFSRSREYQLACSTGLLDALVSESLRCISDYLPKAPRYVEGAVEPGELENVRSDASLEAMLNHSAQLLLTSPHAYAAWEREAFRVIRLRLAA